MHIFSYEACLITKNIYKKYFKMHIKPKIYHSLDKASYNESSLQYLYCA